MSTGFIYKEVPMHRFFCAAALLFAATQTACIAETNPDEVSEERLPAEAPMSRTGLSPYCFWHDHTQVTLRDYGAQPLLDESGLLRAPHFLPSGCDDVPSYVVRCALPAGKKVETASGELYEGRFGLASGWLEAKLTSAEQRFITACLLQHLGGEREVPFTLEGQSPALGGALQSSQPESTLSGNLFMGGTAPVGAAAFQALACVDVGLEETCSDAAEGALRARICGKSARCGLEVVGSCMEVCDYDENGAIANCHGDMMRDALRMQIATKDISTLHGDACR
jgi:hypothetical protein